MEHPTKVSEEAMNPGVPVQVETCTGVQGLAIENLSANMMARA